MSESQDFINGKLLLRIDEAARYLSLGRSHFYKLVLTGTIKSVRIGRSRRIPSYALIDYVQRLSDDTDG